MSRELATTRSAPSAEPTSKDSSGPKPSGICRRASSSTDGSVPG